MKFEAVIGLEVHSQLKTNSKLFSNSNTDFGCDPNSNVSEVDLGLPGVLPVINTQAVDLAIGTLLGNPNLINEDFSMFKSISRKDILIEAKKIFTKTNCTSLYYGKM